MALLLGVIEDNDEKQHIGQEDPSKLEVVLGVGEQFEGEDIVLGFN